MQKATSVLLGASVVLVAALVIFRVGPRKRAPAAVASAPPLSSAVVEPSSEDGGVAVLGGLFDESASRSLVNTGAGSRLLDGAVPPQLPESAPKSVRFGVVLVQYQGAQRAPANARIRADALELAKSLALLAQNDFKAAVDKGDPGSTENAGHISANILEPAPNYVLFSLPAGAVGGPVDTPTGYWIIKNTGK